MSTVRKSLAFSALDSVVGLVLSIASTAIIARILTPEQTGVFAVAAVFASMASTFRDFGVAEYLIQEKQLDDHAIRAALSVNIAVSWLMAVLLFSLAPLAAGFYRSPGVAEVMRVQSASFLLIPFGAVTMAWFRREMNMKPIFIAGLLANAASFAVSIALALRGFGYMSLAWSSLVGVMVTVGVSIWMRPKNFPRWPGLQGVGRVLHFGKFASGVYIFGQMGKSAPELIVGRIQGMAAVGMLSRGGGLVEIFNRLVMRAVMPVCLPFFAKAVRETGTPRKGLLAATAYITGLGWPFLLCIAVGAFAAVRLMYGPQWMAAVPLAQVLCLVGAIELVFFSSKEALLSVGNARDSNTLQISMQSMRIVGLLATAPWGLQAACWGLAAGAMGGATHAYVLLARHGMVTMGELAPVLWRSAQVSLATASPMIVATLIWPLSEANYLVVALGAGSLCLPSWLAALKWTGHPLWPEVKSIGARLGIGARRA